MKLLKDKLTEKGTRILYQLLKLFYEPLEKIKFSLISFSKVN